MLYCYVNQLCIRKGVKMAKPKVFARELTNKEERKLTAIKRKRTVEYSLRQRAEIILLSAKGTEVKLISCWTGLDQSNVIKWIKRFNEGGIDALGDIPKPGRAKEITKDIELKIAAIALSDPRELDKPFNSWTIETIRKETINSGVMSTISWEATRKALKNCGITSQKSCTWKVSKDPDYEVKKKML